LEDQQVLQDLHQENGLPVAVVVEEIIDIVPVLLELVVLDHQVVDLMLVVVMVSSNRQRALEMLELQTLVVVAVALVYLVVMEEQVDLVLLLFGICPKYLKKL
jgi:hypothetical protein|tara:strand:- start:1014 stop:1322 length:309 start_codon:yes stop_codon:yes gene_type:complete